MTSLLGAMKTALDQTRGMKPMEATRTIQAALAARRPVSMVEPKAAPGAAWQTPGTDRTMDADGMIDVTRASPEETGFAGDRAHASEAPPFAQPGAGRPFGNMPLGEGLASRGEALRGRLAAALGNLANDAPAVAPEMPPGARWEARHHAGPAGARDVRVYVPASLDGPAEGLVVLLHGCTQTPEDFATGTRFNALAETHRLVLAYPAQGCRHNIQKCWNWFRAEDQQRGAGEPGIMAGIARELAAEFGVAEGRVFAAGLSAGGALAALLAETHPELFAAVGIHSGLPAGSASDLPSAFAAMRGEGVPRGTGPSVPAIVFHGTADPTVSALNAERILPHAGAPVAGGSASRSWTVSHSPDGSELWRVAGGGHAWFGGDPRGSHTDPDGPDASAEMVRFFLERSA